ncbi:MAG: GNAT family N-acetyltransferase [Pseudomonadota bacterium]
MGITIRDVEVEDIDALVEIVQGQPLWERYGYRPSRVKSDLLGAMESADTVLVAEAGEGAVGFIWLQGKAAFSRSPYLRVLAVCRGSEGQGIGGLLLRRGEESMNGAGGGMFLLVSDFNRDAHRFYLREGYCEVGRIPDYLVQGISERLMFKRWGTHAAVTKNR